MNRSLLLILFLIISNSGFSQIENRRAYAALSFGLSLPQKEFGSISEKEPYAGYANEGYFVEGSFAFRFFANLGAIGMLRIQGNPTDEKSIAKNLAAYNPGRSFKVKSGSWISTGLMLGLNGSFPLDIYAKWIFEVRGLFGILTATSPQIEIQSIRSGSGGSINNEQEIGYGAAFYYLGGAGFRYNISDRLALILKADYLYGKPVFEDVKINVIGNSPHYISFEQPNETINIGAGLALRMMKDRSMERKMKKLNIQKMN